MLGFSDLMEGMYLIAFIGLISIALVLADQRFWSKKRQFRQIFGLPANLPEAEVIGRRVAYIVKQRMVAAQDAESRVLRLKSELNKASVEDDNLVELKKQVAELHEAENTNDHLQKQYRSALDIAQRFDFEINAASDGIWVARYGLNLGVA